MVHVPVHLRPNVISTHPRTLATTLTPMPQRRGGGCLHERAIVSSSLPLRDQPYLPDKSLVGSSSTNNVFAPTLARRTFVPFRSCTFFFFCLLLLLSVHVISIIPLVFNTTVYNPYVTPPRGPRPSGTTRITLTRPRPLPPSANSPPVGSWTNNNASRRYNW
jgi:hypothetical protein